MIWAIAGYTVLLFWLGRRGQRREMQRFFDGGHALSFWPVFILVTALWLSSSVVVEIDTAYQYGVSAMWFGISVALLSILVSLLWPYFQRLGYTTNSGLLGQTYGTMVRRLSGLVIAATFPIFAMSNALAAGFILHVALGMPLWGSLLLTTTVLLIYISFAGMISLAHTQKANLLMILIGLMVAVSRLQSKTLPHRFVPPAHFNNWFGIGTSTIWVWFVMNLLNVFSAQAEFQAIAAAKDTRMARWAVWLSSLVVLLGVGVATWIGMQVRTLFPHVALGGLDAYALAVLGGATWWQKILLVLGAWSLALTWCGPLLFSGAISLGRDVVVGPTVLRTTRMALWVEGFLMIAYALFRPAELAWWRVFGLTLRNAAIVGPTLVVLIWPDLEGSSVAISMFLGVGSGLLFNAISGFSATHFWGGINPMWIAASISFAALALLRLWSKAKYLTFGLGLLFVASMFALLHQYGSPLLQGFGLLGLSLGLLFWAWLSTKATTLLEDSVDVV